MRKLIHTQAWESEWQWSSQDRHWKFKGNTVIVSNFWRKFSTDFYSQLRNRQRCCNTGTAPPSPNPSKHSGSGRIRAYSLCSSRAGVVGWFRKTTQLHKDIRAIPLISLFSVPRGWPSAHGQSYHHHLVQAPAHVKEKGSFHSNGMWKLHTLVLNLVEGHTQLQGRLGNTESHWADMCLAKIGRRALCLMKGEWKKGSFGSLPHTQTTNWEDR